MSWEDDDEAWSGDVDGGGWGGTNPVSPAPSAWGRVDPIFEQMYAPRGTDAVNAAAAASVKQTLQEGGKRRHQGNRARSSVAQNDQPRVDCWNIKPAAPEADSMSANAAASTKARDATTNASVTELPESPGARLHRLGAAARQTPKVSRKLPKRFMHVLREAPQTLANGKAKGKNAGGGIRQRNRPHSAR